MHQSYQDNKIIVVDDGSIDGTYEMVKTKFASVEIIKGDGNLWWTGAINEGIKFVLDICDHDDFILVLNDDLIVPENYVSSLIEASMRYPNTIIGSLLADIDNKDIIMSGGYQIDWRYAIWTDINSGKSRSSFPPKFVLPVSTLTGRGVLFPIEVFKKIGLYDYEHILQCGDTELPIRARKSGYKLIVNYDSVVFSIPGPKDNINNKNPFTLLDVKEYFWGNKSHTNLRTRFWFAISAFEKDLWQTSRYLFFDVLRITGHFLRRLRILQE